MTFIQKLIPTNLSVERDKFAFDPNYNPQFAYSEVIPAAELVRYTHISDKYVSIAQKILETAEEKKLTAVDEQKKDEYLSKEEVEKTIHAYLEKEGLRKTITLRFADHAVARTSIHQNTLILRLPLEYTKSGLDGMLLHEIGTHQFRSMNDRKQVWRGKAAELQLKPYFLTEEGLAVLHSQIPRSEKLLVFQAINYLAVLYAHEHSFSETNTMLKKYVKDWRRRFDICVRVKRGMKDTSLPGAFTKDQIYLAGAIEVWKWLQKRDFDPTDLYMGKIAMEDAETLKPLAKSEPLLLPTFITEDHVAYKKEMTFIGKSNFLSNS